MKKLSLRLITMSLVVFAAVANAQIVPFGFMKSSPVGGYRYYRFVVDSTTGADGRSVLTNLQFKWNGTWQTNAMTSNTSGTIGSYSPTITETSFNGGALYQGCAASLVVEKALNVLPLLKFLLKSLCDYNPFDRLRPCPLWF